MARKGATSQGDANLRKKIEAWRDAFKDKETGIHKTLGELLWNYAAFSTTVRIVHMAARGRESERTLNQMIFNLISNGHWSGLLLGARRLLDNQPLRGPKGVYSLRSVIRDIRLNHSKINRRVYVEWVCGAEYELERLKSEQFERWRAAPLSNKTLWVSQELVLCEASHRQFDILSGSSEHSRKPEDLIDKLIFHNIEKRLSALNSIRSHVASHIAHAGNSESRIGKELASFDIRDARLLLEELKQIADLVGLYFVNEVGIGLPACRDDQFEGLDLPVIAQSDMAELETHWQEIARDIESWCVDVGYL